MSSQNRHWILTIPEDDFDPNTITKENFTHIRGQLERGNESGYTHWQIVCCFPRKRRLRYVKEIFGSRCHAEPTRSAAANDYVWKDDTAVPDTRFEFGQLPHRRGCSTDWDAVVRSAREGNLATIPSDVLVRYYGNLKRICMDNLQPVELERRVVCYWGATGVGKSRRAWDEAGLQAYPKDPRTKFWDGYQGQESVVIDEFRGAIDISHILRWCDRYPCIVEVKGSATVLKATHIIFTSNLNPILWYPMLDCLTLEALLRRIVIYEIKPI